jgi:hypothetical protein
MTLEYLNLVNAVWIVFSFNDRQSFLNIENIWYKNLLESGLVKIKESETNSRIN